MKLLIFTCLMAVALARPKFSPRYPELIQNEPDSTEEVLNERKFFKFALPLPRELRKEYINELNRRELLREKQSDDIKEYVMNDSEQNIPGSGSSSEEIVHSSTEQKHIPKEDVLNQRSLKRIPTQKLLYYPYLEQLPRINENNRIQLREPTMNQEQAYIYIEPFQQPDAYPYDAWYYPPHVMQYSPYTPFFGITQPIVSEDIE